MRLRKIIAQCLLCGFLLGIHNGRIALWRSDDPQPCRVFPYPVATLPQQVRQALEKGISIESDEALDQLLESLCS